jgi:hypothetical protein
MVQKRIKVGYYLRGPEPCGCFNSGFAPIIYHVPKQYRGRSWIVCRDIMLQEARIANIRERTKRIIYPTGRTKGWAIYLYTTRVAAQKKYEELCQAILDDNKTQAEKARELQARIKENPTDVEAVLELGDMGLI